MSFPRYPSYKPSGIEWLGRVPEHWEVKPCRAIVNERTSKNEGAACQDYLSLMANVGIIPYADKGDVGNKKPEDLSKCKVVTRGDFVINSMNYGIGSYGLSDYDGVCSPVYIVLKPQNEVVQSRYAFRIFENRAFQTYAQSFGNGILEHRCAINWDILKPIGVAVPPLDEQQAILAFLDRETGKIDALVAEQRRLMELLKEKRQAVISHAVTQGLNPKAPMKDSGIEWLGKVPKHWEVKPLGRITLSRCDGPFGSGLKSEHYAESGVRVIRLQNIRAEGFNDSDAAFIDKDYHDTELTGHEVAGGDVLIAGLGDDNNLVGRACVAPDGIEPAMVKADCFRFRLDRDQALPAFVATILSVSATFDAGMLATGTTRSRIPLSITCGRRIPLPPLAEQKAIVSHLEVELGKFDTLTAEAQRAIDLLQERRTALISAAVTGQIDVRAADGRADGPPAAVLAAADSPTPHMDTPVREPAEAGALRTRLPTRAASKTTRSPSPVPPITLPVPARHPHPPLHGRVPGAEAMQAFWRSGDPADLPENPAVAAVIDWLNRLATPQGFEPALARLSLTHPQVMDTVLQPAENGDFRPMEQAHPLVLMQCLWRIGVQIERGGYDDLSAPVSERTDAGLNVFWATLRRKLLTKDCLPPLVFERGGPSHSPDDA